MYLTCFEHNSIFPRNTHSSPNTLGKFCNFFFLSRKSTSFSQGLHVPSIAQGRIQDFKLGGAHLKKLRRAEGFYAKKS
jgi:hypothetical protein